MQNPLVSIVITFFDTEEQYACACLESVVSQTYDNLQIILSQYGNDSICDEYALKDSRINVLYGQNNGMCPARNAGLDICKGEWICIIDGDDFVDSKYVEFLLKAATENDTLVAQCKYVNTLGIETFAEQCTYQTNAFELEELIIHNEYAQGFQNQALWDKIWHRSLFDNIRFPDTRNGFDLVTICRMLYVAKSRRFAVVNQVLYFYRQTLNSLSRSKRSLRSLDAWKYDYIDSMEFWRSKGLTQIYKIFFKYAYGLSVRFAIECMRDIPEHADKIHPIIEFAKQNMNEAIFAGLKCLTVNYGSHQIWDYIVGISDRSGVVMYGFGRIGQNDVYPWLKHFKIRINEIWDVRGDNGTIDGIVFCKPHDNANENTIILLTILDEYVSAQAETQLRKLGYTNIITYPVLYDAIKYTAYRKYLPFLYSSGLSSVDDK